MRWTNNKEQHEYINYRRAQNLVRHSAAEQWAWPHIAKTGGRWERQAVWGLRIFDFFSIKRGIAVEIDGPEHNKEYDAARDKYNYYRSGILVLRVRNFNDADLKAAIAEIKKGETRKQRRKRVRVELGLPETAAMKDAVEKAGLKLAHCNWQPERL
jgi:very-short-patch-repair endonuclease